MKSELEGGLVVIFLLLLFVILSAVIGVHTLMADPLIFGFASGGIVWVVFRLANIVYKKRQ